MAHARDERQIMPGETSIMAGGYSRYAHTSLHSHRFSVVLAWSVVDSSFTFGNFLKPFWEYFKSMIGFRTCRYGGQIVHYIIMGIFLG
jgi:hypothetical protein